MTLEFSLSQNQTKSFTLTSAAHNIELGNWEINNHQLGIENVLFSIQQICLHGGKQEGSRLIIIKCPDGLTITLSPTRGMNVIEATAPGIRLGWDSPVKEIVNPTFINLQSRNGTGWLEGFNEMMVRCGYEWSGHPFTDTNGELYSLHGKAANTPASEVIVEIDTLFPYEIKIKGLIKESTFKKTDLRVLTELSYIPGSHSFTLHDRLTNHADYSHPYQIIYHSNFGKPLLEKDAKFIAPVKEISPFNNYAQNGLDNWQTYREPTKDFDEMVFNIIPYTKKDGSTMAALHNKSENKGVSIEFNTKQLPFLTLWKNTDTEKQGYVTGIEPGTNFAYPMTIEREQGRLKKLHAGKTVEFKLRYNALLDRQAVEIMKKEITNIQGNQETQINQKPVAQE